MFPVSVDERKLGEVSGDRGLSAVVREGFRFKASGLAEFSMSYMVRRLAFPAPPPPPPWPA